MAPVNSDSSDSDFSLSSPIVERTSGLAGQDRPSELMLMNFHFFIWIQMFNLVSLNINGLNDPLKGTALIDWVKCLKADIVCLQETRASSHESIRKWFANSGYRIASSCHTNKSAGTAILVKDTFKIIKIIKDDAGRFVQVLVFFFSAKISLVLFLFTLRTKTRNGTPFF